MWHEFKISLPDEQREPVTGVLFELGSQGITEEDGCLTAYFPEDANPEEISQALSGFDGVSVAYSPVGEQDWYSSWKENITPFHAAGFLICPPWRLEGCSPGEGEKLLVLDPGNAFGTGDHVTTMSVLEMLREWTASVQGLSGKRFLDLGTGTGILSIAAYLYGIRDITAVDIEQPAIETAAGNFALNGLTDKVTLIKGSIGDAGSGFDLIAANIFQEALVELMPDTVRALNPGGSLIVSGLLAGQEGPVISSAEKAGLKAVSVNTSKGWVSALFRA